MEFHKTNMENNQSGWHTCCSCGVCKSKLSFKRVITKNVIVDGEITSTISDYRVFECSCGYLQSHEKIDPAPGNLN